MSAACRPFKMRVYNTSEREDDENDEEFLFFQKDFRCTCCCFNRPDIKVYYSGGAERVYLGKAVAPCMACNIQLNVLDANDREIYKIHGSCCQLGLCCKGWPCEPCQTVGFDLFDTVKGEKVGALEKRTAGCLKSAVSDTSNFVVRFPEGCSKENKALLMATVIMLDYENFMEKVEQRREDGNL